MAQSDFFHIPEKNISINLSHVVYIAWGKEGNELVARPTAINGGMVGNSELRGKDAERLREHVGYEAQEDTKTVRSGIHA